MPAGKPAWQAGKLTPRLKPLLGRIEKGQIDPSFVVTHRMGGELRSAVKTGRLKPAPPHCSCIAALFSAPRLLLRAVPNNGTGASSSRSVEYEG